MGSGRSFQLGLWRLTALKLKTKTGSEQSKPAEAGMSASSEDDI
jgi:hypothetical protein